MPRRIVYASLILLLTLVSACRSPSASGNDTVLQGRVLLVSAPGPIPVGWTPPPLEEVNVVLVLDDRKNIVKEVATDASGKFRIVLSPHTYYLRVKYSPIPVETGPYTLQNGQTLTVEAHYDVAVR